MGECDSSEVVIVCDSSDSSEGVKVARCDSSEGVTVVMV